MSHNVGTRLLSGLLVSFASGVVERNCWMKQQSNTHIQGHFRLSKLAVWVLFMGQRASQHSTGGVCWYSKKNIIWNHLKIMISTSKQSKMRLSPFSHLLLCIKTRRGEQGVLVYPMLNSHCNISSSH